MISIIAAVARNGVMGRGNDLPWSLPTDLAHFRKATAGQPVIMGKNTWDSLPDAFRPLPKRKNIIVSTTLLPDDETAVMERDDGSVIWRSLLGAIASCHGDAWIIGGAKLYGSALEHDVVDQIILSELIDDFEGDVFFPHFDRSIYHETSRIPIRNDTHHYDIVTYTRAI